MSDEEASHTQCVTLRIDPSTLKEIEQKLDGVTLSTTLGASINRTLKVMAASAEEEK